MHPSPTAPAQAGAHARVPLTQFPLREGHPGLNFPAGQGKRRLAPYSAAMRVAESSSSTFHDFTTGSTSLI